ncbi:MAG: sigma-70 family RNA polymerase sigma factor [Acidobacteria bacterium]|nr:sigma-70 family RNA polymerase sigma factor [Acidobacteriota bacterium]
MPAPLDASLVARLYLKAKAADWQIPLDTFAGVLATSAEKLFGDGGPRDAAHLEQRLMALHLEDLALACACAAGHEAAWERFIREQRPHLYRSADAIDSTGGARELADSLYGELFGLTDREGRRNSLFRYFHGRSSLTTWLRAILAQRHVDRLRATRRLDPLPDPDTGTLQTGITRPTDPERPRFLTLIQQAVRRAVTRLHPRDRLRLGCYYGQTLTLAQTGRLLGEHEATASRQLARTRRVIRDDVESQLRIEVGLNEAQIARCFEIASEDARSIDLTESLSTDVPARNAAPLRSTGEGKAS